MNCNPNRGDSRKEKKINDWKRSMIIGTLLAGSLALSVYGVEPTTATAGANQSIGFRYDNTGVFPPDARPPTDFDGPSGSNLLWKAPLPNFGNASPIVVPAGTGARVLVLCDHGWPLGEGETPVLLCYNAESGKELWRKAIDPLDALPVEEAAPLRAARHAFWRHQHEARRLCARYNSEANTPEAKETLKTELAKHVPDLGQSKPVERIVASSGKAWVHWTAALNHPDCEVLRSRKGKPALLGASSSWNWTGIGQAMCTPISDGEAVYVITGLCTVTKLDLDGKVLWHRFEKDVEQTQFYECWLANGLHLLSSGTGGNARRLLVFECYEHLWAYDCATGQIVWKTHTTSRGGHVCGTPQILRLPDGKGEELLVVTRSGHVIRVRDGAALAEDMFNVNYNGPLSDGRDRVWIKQVGGDGGHFSAFPGSPFDKKCMAGLRYVGGWLGTRGAISNGFKSGGPTTGEFKVFGTECGDKPDYPLWCGVMEGLPRAFLENKTPEGFQVMKGAEEWIPHSGAWLSAISRLRQTRKE